MNCSKLGNRQFRSGPREFGADRDVAQISGGDLVRCLARRMNIAAGVSLLAWSPWRQRWALRLAPKILVPFLVTSDVVQSIEDIHAVLDGVFLGAFQPLWINHLQHLRAVLMFPLAGVPDDPPPGDGTHLLAKAEKGVDGCLEASATVPSEDEFVAIDVDVLLTKAVVRPHGPALEVGEDAMNPLQHDVGW